ncbi:13512_t:CDS:2, partial [Ambispora leptoticha]
MRIILKVIYKILTLTRDGLKSYSSLNEFLEKPILSFDVERVTSMKLTTLGNKTKSDNLVWISMVPNYTYFLFLTFALITFENVNSQVARYGHTANLINQKIYIIGGKDATGAFVNEMQILDLSSNFSLANISNNFIKITSLNFSVAWGTSVDNGSNIFYFGGVTSENKTTADIIQYDPKQNQISKPLEVSASPSARRGLNSVIDQNGKWYIYGGSSDVDDNYHNLTSNSDTAVYYLMLTSNDDSLTFATKMFPDQTLNRFDYTATVIGNNIIYIGGLRTTNDFIGMEEIGIFQTDTMEWRKIIAANAAGLVPNRGGHTAVKLNDNSILIYGGYSPNPMNNSNAVALLSIQNLGAQNGETFTWKLPTISSSPYQNQQQIPYWHTATIYNNYMIVVYGKFDNTMTTQPAPVAILDVSNEASMTWVQSITSTPIATTPTITPITTKPKSGGKKNNPGKQKELKDGQIQDSIQSTQNLAEMVQESNSNNPEMVQHSNNINRFVQSHHLPEKIMSKSNNQIIQQPTARNNKFNFHVSFHSPI